MIESQVVHIPVNKIGKQAVTIHVFSDSLQGNAFECKAVTYRQIKTVTKITNKFLRNMKNSKCYYFKNRFRETFYQTILDHLDKKQDDMYKNSIHLTWLQYQIHSFITHIFPNYYDGINSVKGYKKFYKKTLEELLR